MKETNDKVKKLELVLEGQYDKTIVEHVRYPLYIDNFENALRVIFLNILRRKQEGYKAEEAENIIPFLGKRGSGKTTAMEDFCDILQNLKKESECEWWVDRVIFDEDFQIVLKEKGFFFHVLRLIDASMLEGKEDVFELIMSEIFTFYRDKRQNTCFQRREDSELHRKIMKDFEDILKGYYAIRDSREDEFIDSYIAKLGYVSESFNLRERIGKLIEVIFREFLKCDQEYFLVIALDDLDLNIGHGYEILRQLQKYFSAPHILITFSADYDQLNRVCWCHYIQEFSREKSHVIEDLVKEHCLGLGRDYIEKVLPLSNRIYMLNLNNKTRKTLVVRPVGLNGDFYTIKQYVMNQIASYLRIYYDMCGVKEHFTEPETVRKLVSFDWFLKGFQDISVDMWNEEGTDENDNRVFMELYDQNHERYNHDIENRMVASLLSVEQQKDFRSWLRLSLERRAESACIYMKESYAERRKQEKDAEPGIGDFLGEVRSNTYETDGVRTAQADPDHTYSFGSLLENIYQYGRMNAEKKAYVKCLLASLTSEMVREKISFRKNPNEREKEVSRQRLYRFMGNTFGNLWLGDMMPKKNLGKKKENIGFRQNNFGKSMNQNLFPMPNKSKRIDYWLNEFKEEITEKKVIPSLEWLFCFVTVPSGTAERKDLPIHLKTGEPFGKERKIFLQIDFSGVEMCVGIWEFIPKTLELVNYVNWIHEKLAEEFCGVIFSYKERLKAENKETVRKEILQYIKSESMFSEYLENSSYNVRSVVPFYELDFAYNVFKRARRELREENPKTCDRDEMFFYIRKAYRKLIEKMEEEEGEYAKIDINLDYSWRLKEFPLIQILLNEEAFAKIHGNIKKTLVNTLWGSENVSNPDDVYVGGEKNAD